MAPRRPGVVADPRVVLERRGDGCALQCAPHREHGSRIHALERRPGELFLVGKIDELARGELVLHGRKLRRLARHACARDRELRTIANALRPHPVELEVQRDLALLHAERGEWVHADGRR